MCSLWETTLLTKICLMNTGNIFQNLFDGTQVSSHVSEQCLPSSLKKKGGGWWSSKFEKFNKLEWIISKLSGLIALYYFSQFLCVRNSERAWLDKAWDFPPQLLCYSDWCWRSGRLKQLGASQSFLSVSVVSEFSMWSSYESWFGLPHSMAALWHLNFIHGSSGFYQR